MLARRPPRVIWACPCPHTLGVGPEAPGRKVPPAGSLALTLSRVVIRARGGWGPRRGEDVETVLSGQGEGGERRGQRQEEGLVSPREWTCLGKSKAH